MKQPRGAAGNDLIFFIFFLVVLGIIWGLTGGPDRAISHEGPFLNAPFPLGNGGAYTVPGVPIPSGENVRDTTSSGDSSGGGVLADIISRIRGGVGSASENVSPYAQYVSLSIGRAKASSPDDEYLILKTGNAVEGRLTISDWRIESSVTLAGTTLGGAAYLPFSGQVNTESPVAIGPNTTVYLETGRSPIGTSFRLNSCVGYFEQFQDFQPKLRQECPTPEAELTRKTSEGFVPNNACIETVKDIDRCILTVQALPGAIGSQCQNFILEDLTYSGCVTAHKNESDFYKNEWRIYLDRDQELWKQSNERIRLLDENGLVIDSISY